MSNTRRHAACLAFGLCLITLAVNLQAPLYTAYAELSGYGAAATASAFSGYVLGVLPVLLVLGGLSDRIGRKPPIVVALLLSMVATLVMALWPRLEALGVGERSTVALCPSLPFGMFERLRQQAPGRNFVSAAPLIDQGRMRKSAEELALMQRAKDMTLEVQKAAASILREGISTTEVAEFIHQAHRKVGAPGSTFCIVLFGAASAFPHGVKHAQVLKDGDMVLIDTGCQVHGYQSDITRSYVFGTPSARQREFWGMERDAQLAAFEAARLGQPCEAVDAAARRSLEANGLGPDYRLPGLPHRTGHGIGMDVHEGPYLVRGDRTPLDVGMCFSNEPMICVPGEFGIRLEDHFYMTKEGPRWFTQPSPSIDDPFGLGG